MCIVLGVGVWQGLHEYNRTNKDLRKVKANVKISVIDLIKEYNDNDSSANQKYLGKIIEVTGNIKEVNTDDKGYYTVVLGDAGNMSSVRCSMDTSYQQHAAKLAAGSSITIRGVCTGFNQDEMGLGSDVIMNRCVVVSNKNN